MRKQVVGLGIMTLALLLPGAAVQAQSEYGGEPASYLGVTVFGAFDNSSGDVEDEVDDDESWGVNARAGIRLAPALAIEIQGEYNHAWEELDIWTATANFRVYPMLTEWVGWEPGVFQPFAVGGIGVIAGDPKDEDYQLNGAFRLGLGVDFYLTEQLAIEGIGEWTTGTGHWNDADFFKLGVGLQYNF
jgi:opacity protein-like surface antigen